MHDKNDTTIVTKSTISCDGNVGTLGHPRVWLVTSPETGWVECGYCNQRYVLAPDAAEDAH